VQVAAVFAKQFQFVYSTSPVAITVVCFTVIFLQLPPISKLGILKAINPLRPSQSVALDGAPGIIICCKTKFAPLPYIYVLYHYLSPGKLPTHFKKAVIVSNLKKLTYVPSAIVGRICFLNNIPNSFPFVTQLHVTLNQT